jgi:hypothetical protein
LEGRKIRKVGTKCTFAFGLPIPHAQIYFSECLLHMTNRMDFKKWQACGKDQDSMEIRKETIQKQLEIQTGLADNPKLGGSGTSNDGNTAARFFFLDPESAASKIGMG